MTLSLVDAKSVLAVDIGSSTTRAHLFDVVDGQYSFIAAGSSPTTLQAPYRDISEGVHQAVLALQAVTGRHIIGEDSRLVLPSQSDGTGVDRFVMTYSTGPAPRVIIAGLLSDVSLASAQRLVSTVYGQIVETIGLNDRRRLDTQIDAIIQARADMIVIAGGTEGGATRSVYKLVDLVNLACRSMPPEQRPEVIFAGNQALAKRIKENLEKWTKISVAPNIRPSIDLENLAPAQQTLIATAGRLRSRQMTGLQSLASITSTEPVPSAFAFGRMVHFLSLALDPSKGVLGVDLGNASTVIAAGASSHHTVNVFPFGMGRGAAQALQQISLPEIMKWLPMPLAKSIVRDYLWQKSITPDLLPQDVETMAIEQAFARQVLRLAVLQFQARFPEYNRALEPILGSGGTLTQVPSAQALLTLIDGLQPVGVTTFVLDQNNLAAALGAAASFNPVLPAQVLETGAFLNLGTVISPLSPARYGTPVVKARIEFERGDKSTVEVKQGSIAVLPIQAGQAARIHLQGLNSTLLDPRTNKSSMSFKVIGGVCGALIDARGRPLNLPADDARRMDLLKKWSLNLGG